MNLAITVRQTTYKIILTINLNSMNYFVPRIRNYGRFGNYIMLETFIQNAVQRLGLDFSVLVHKTRKTQISRKRQVLAYILHKQAGIPCAEVGQIFRGMDHSTVLHSCKKTKEGLSLSYADTCHFYDMMIEEFNSVTDQTAEIIKTFENCPQF